MVGKTVVQLELPFDEAQDRPLMDIAQLETTVIPGVIVGKVYQSDGRWHAEIGEGWWVFIAGTREAAINGVIRVYEQETGKVYA